jgi:hypothetical protein
MLFAQDPQCFLVQLTFLAFLGIRESIDFILPFGPFCLGGDWGLIVELGVILDVLEYQKEGSSTQGSGILRQVLSSLPLGQTHVQ